MYKQKDRLLIALKLGPILAFALDPDPTSESENGFGDQGVYVDFQKYIVDALCLAAGIVPCHIYIVTRCVNLYGLFELFIVILVDVGT